MPKLTNIASLTTVEVTINAVAKTIKLNIAGNLSSDGVSLKTLYAYLKNQWKLSATFIQYAFPFNAVTDTKFDMVQGWDFADAISRNLIRDGGWALKNITDNVTSLEEWANINSVGVSALTDQLYYTQIASQNGSTVGTPIAYAGPANHAVKIYGDATKGSIDYRTNFTLFVREQGKTYDQETLASIGVTTLSYGSYFFPLDATLDRNIATADAVIDANATYTGMSITYSATPVARVLGGTSYNFTTIINGNGGTRKQIYEFVQRQLRKVTDIDASVGTQLGKTTPTLVKFLGDTLVTNTGIYIDNVGVADSDFVEFYDNTATLRKLPYQAAGALRFNDILVNDVDSIYRVYFTNSFGTGTAVIVKNVAGVDLSGTVSGLASIPFSFDYDGNVQGGRTAGTDASITIVALGITSGQYSRTTATIGRNILNNIFIAASAERNYSAS